LFVAPKDYKSTVVLNDFDPAENYTVEASVTINSCTGRGFKLQSRNGEGNGFRISLNSDSIQYIAPFAKPNLISAGNTGKQTLRMAVAGKDVHIYQNGLYRNTFPLETINNLDSAGKTECSFNRSIAVTDPANLIANPQFLGLENNAAPTGWLSEVAMGGGTQPRVQVNNSEWPNTSVFMFRFDSDTQYGTWFSYPVTLKPDTWYEYSFDNINWGGRTGSYLVIASTSESGSTNIAAQQTVTIPETRKAIERKLLRFKTASATSDNIRYYLTFKKSGSVGTTGVSNLTLIDNNINGLLFGKNYTDGSLDYKIDYITCDMTDAFAPEDNPVAFPETKENYIGIYVNRQILHITQLPEVSTVKVYDISGRNCFTGSDNNEMTVKLPEGVYIISIVSDSERIVRKVMVK
jgi:hypothetical protein